MPRLVIVNRTTNGRPDSSQVNSMCCPHEHRLLYVPSNSLCIVQVVMNENRTIERIETRIGQANAIFAELYLLRLQIMCAGTPSAEGRKTSPFNFRWFVIMDAKTWEIAVSQVWCHFLFLESWSRFYVSSVQKQCLSKIVCGRPLVHLIHPCWASIAQMVLTVHTGGCRSQWYRTHPPFV